jgi:hypothetical protein
MNDEPEEDHASGDDGGEVQDFERVDGSSDCFAPPKEPCECECLHCGRTFMSSEIWLQRIIGDPHMEGFWMCPTPNCDGAGFTFDIFPTDPNHPANAGWHDFDDADFSEEELTDDLAGSSSKEWDPSETEYEALDDDLDGEEWKHGLQPGGEFAIEHEEELLPGAGEEEEREKRYDMPDERPRVLDWTDRPDRHSPPVEGDWNEDDIPF